MDDDKRRQLLRKENVLIIDVRSKDEYNEANYKNSLNIVHTDIAKIYKDSIPLDKEIVLYCAAGRRAEAAKKTLDKLGYTNVTNVGGYNDIKDL